MEIQSKHVKVNGIDVLVCDSRVVVHEFSGHMPTGWKLLNATNWIYQTLDNADTLLKAAGHDPSKIDLAVPQSWWDEQYQRWKEAPKACWSYEKNKIFGEPLYISTVVQEFEEALRQAWIKDI